MEAALRATILAGLGLLLVGCQSPAPTALPSAAATAQSLRQWTVAADLQITQIRDDVWVHTSWHLLPGNRRFPSNGLIVRDRDALLLVDTAWGAEPTRRLLDWIDRELRLPVRQAIATHFHDDRLGGWPVLQARGIPMLVTPQTRTLARAEGNAAPASAGLPALAGGESLRVGPLEVFHPGHAHSADNLVVWLPHARLLFGGCAVKSAAATAMGNVADADLASWQRAIERLQARYPQIDAVVPGHQDSGGAELLEHTLELLRAHPA